MTSSIRTPKCHCTNCKHELDSAASSGDYQPQPGNYTICVYCSHIMVFSDDLSVREPTDAELISVADYPELKKTLQAISEIQKSIKGGK